MNSLEFTDAQRSNAACRFCYSIMNIALVLCYLLEVVKGSRTIGYFIVFAFLALFPLLVTHLLYRKDRESVRIRYTIAIGFGIFYLFIIFTTISPVAYVYSMLVSVLFLVYSEIKLTVMFSSAIALGNIIQVAYMAISGQLKAEDLPNVEIRIGSIILFTIFMIISTRTMEKNNQNKLNLINEEKERTAALMEKLLETSGKITSSIQVVSEKMNILESSSSKTMSSMEEVAQGTNDTAESIQNQLERTEDIQKTIQKVNHASGMIDGNIAATKDELKKAQNNIDNLIHHVTVSNQENIRVSTELAELNEYTSQMQSIIHIIDEITVQTSLLSLNASIEAARAGEAGKGFEVVASEISTLAAQTQTATEHITVLIENISGELSKVVTAIEDMIENSNAQNTAANNTALSFRQIASATEEVYRESSVLKDLVSDLTKANQSIVSGIETISAATEEVTAHSNETFENCAENTNIATEVGHIVEELNQMASELVNREE